MFQATGPTSGANVWVKIGAKKDGRITAAEAILKYQAGAFQGSPIQPGCMCAFAPYDLANVKVVGYDVVTNRPKVAAYRAPGAPISEFAVESVIDEIADKLGMDPIEFRLQERRQGGHASRLRPEVRADRPGRDAGGRRQGQRALPDAAGTEPGPRRRLRLLVQHRRRDLGLDPRQRGRHGHAHGGHARHRRLARLARA